jgi:hypothetical protein
MTKCRRQDLAESAGCGDAQQSTGVVRSSRCRSQVMQWTPCVSSPKGRMHPCDWPRPRPAGPLRTCFATPAATPSPIKESSHSGLARAQVDHQHRTSGGSEWLGTDLTFGCLTSDGGASPLPPRLRRRSPGFDAGAFFFHTVWRSPTHQHRTPSTSVPETSGELGFI